LTYNLGGFSPWSVVGVALGLWQYSTSWFEWEAYSLHDSWEAKREEETRAHSPSQGYAPTDLRSPTKLHLLKAPLTSNSGKLRTNPLTHRLLRVILITNYFT
jgi:hypothetical protein